MSNLCKSNKKSLCMKMLKQFSLKLIVSKLILFRIRNSNLKKLKIVFKCLISKIEKTVKYLNSVTETLSNELKNEVKSEDFKKFLRYFNSLTNKQKDNLSIKKKTSYKTNSFKICC